MASDPDYLAIGDGGGEGDYVDLDAVRADVADLNAKDAAAAAAAASLPVIPVEVSAKKVLARVAGRRSARKAVGGALGQAVQIKRLAEGKLGGVVHFKGFASNIDFNNKNTLAGVCAAVRELNRYSVVVFDGDEISPDSFTWLLTNDLFKKREKMGDHGYRIPELTVKKFVAFSTNGAVGGHLNKCMDSARAAMMSVNDAVVDLRSPAGDGAKKPAWSVGKIGPGLTGVLVDKTWEEDGEWHHLGVKAIQTTGSKNVVAFGGGKTVLNELRDSEGVKFTVVPIHRKNGEQTHMCTVEGIGQATANKSTVSFILFGGGSRIVGGVGKSCVLPQAKPLKDDAAAAPAK